MDESFQCTFHTAEVGGSDPATRAEWRGGEDSFAINDRKNMGNLSAKHWFVSIKRQLHLTIIDEDGPHGPYPETLCEKSSLERKGATYTEDNASGTECKRCLKRAGYYIPTPKQPSRRR
jgi:hypothetical protein